MYLGLDLGTSSLKAVLLDGELVAQWSGEAKYEIDLTPTQAQIAPSAWWEACIDVLDRAPSSLRRAVRSIGISGQMHGVVLCDDRGRPLRDAVLWPDRRAVEQLDVFRDIDVEDRGVLGNPIVPGMPGPVLAWLAAHEPDVLARARSAVAPKDWLRARITAESPIVTDASDASATLMYDVWRDRWSAAAVECAGVDGAQIPEVVGSAERSGVVSADAGAQLGLEPGTVVSVGAGDAASALLGSGIERPGTVLVNVGTGAQVLAVVDAPGAGISERGLHQFRTADGPGRWYVMAPIVNAGLALSWVRSVLGLTWDEMYAQASAALERHGSDPVFAPFLAGERDPDVGLEARASWSKLSGQHDAAAMARSAVLGVTAYIARRVREVVELTGAGHVVLSGGASRREAWSGLLADLVGLDLHLASDTNSSARGAAVLAARAIGDRPEVGAAGEVVRPTPGVRRFVEQLELD